MLKYPDFYRKHGVRYVRDLITPIIWKAEDIAFPRSTMHFWYNGGMAETYPTHEYGYFKNIDKAVVYPITSYHKDALMGHPKHKSYSESKIRRNGKKADPKFKYVELGKPLKLSSSVPIIFNAGVLNPTYRYMSHPLTDYHVWHNALSTVADIMKTSSSGGGRHKYLFVNLPYVIPDKEVLLRNMGDITRQSLKVFNDYTYFNMLEIFRFMHGDYKKYSILANTLAESEFENIDLVLTINNNISIINLGMLASISDQYEYATSLKKYPSITCFKIIYIFLNRLLEAIPEGDNSIELPVEHGVVSGKKPEAEEKIKEVDLDHLIKHEVVSPDADENLGDTDDVDAMIAESEQDVIEDKLSEDLDVKSMDDIVKGKPVTDHSSLENKLNVMEDSKLVTKSTKSKLIDTLKKQETIKSPYNNGKSLHDMLTYEDDEIQADESTNKITPTPSVIDPTMNRDSLKSLNAKYTKRTMRKDILNTIYSVQKSGTVITDHQVDETKSVLGNFETHTIGMQTIGGSKSTVRIKLPIVNDDNTMRISGNKYLLRTQRSDIPIKKISNTIVSLNSYYGKMFISKATFKKDDLGFWFQKQLLKKYDNDKQLKDISLLPVNGPDMNVPVHYGMFSRYVKGFKYKTIVFGFEYGRRDTLIKDVDLDKVEKSGVLVGSKAGTPVVMGMDNHLYVLGKEKIDLGTMFEHLDLDISKAPIEYCNAKIYKTQIPVVIMLSYYIGLHKLLDLLKVKYHVEDSKTRTKLSPDEYKIVFKDHALVITRDYGQQDLIFSGFRSIAKYIKLLPIDAFDSRTRYSAVFKAMDLPILYVNEIKLMETMFIDPITKQVLELYKQPTTFMGIMLKATEMLADDNYKHPNAIDGVIFKGYERISGMLYLELVNSVRSNMNRSHFGKSKIDVNPYAVMSRISEDSTTALIDDLNPVAELKQHEDVTYLGLHGRKEESMSMATRAMHKSEIGVVSESTKDSGAVGISSYLTASPNLTTTRGTVGKQDLANGWSSILSTSGMLAPFAAKDDVKRLNNLV